MVEAELTPPAAKRLFEDTLDAIQGFENSLWWATNRNHTVVAPTGTPPLPSTSPELQAVIFASSPNYNQFESYKRKVQALIGTLDTIQAKELQTRLDAASLACEHVKKAVDAEKAAKQQRAELRAQNAEKKKRAESVASGEKVKYLTPSEQLVQKMRQVMEPCERAMRECLVENYTARCQKIMEQLARDGWDANISYKYPSGVGSRSDYMRAAARYKEFQSYTEPDRVRNPSGTTRWNGPSFVRPKADNAQAINLRAAREAYEYVAAFCWKLAGKMEQEKCPVTAEMSYRGGDPWSYSFVVATAGGREWRWKTKMILNVSGLGTPYNQWPTTFEGTGEVVRGQQPAPALADSTPPLRVRRG